MAEGPFARPAWDLLAFALVVAYFVVSCYAQYKLGWEWRGSEEKKGDKNVKGDVREGRDGKQNSDEEEDKEVV